MSLRSNLQSKAGWSEQVNLLSLCKLGTLPNGELSVCESVETGCKYLLKLKLFNSLILQGILILRLDFQSQQIV